MVFGCWVVDKNDILSGTRPNSVKIIFEIFTRGKSEGCTLDQQEHPMIKILKDMSVRS